MKQPTDTFFDTGSVTSIARQLNDVIRRANAQLNAISEGRVSALHTAQVAPPLLGIYAVGDFVPNSARGEVLGLVTEQYLLWGWTCTSATEPPVWAEMRIPTGT